MFCILFLLLFKYVVSRMQLAVHDGLVFTKSQRNVYLNVIALNLIYVLIA